MAPGGTLPSSYSTPPGTLPAAAYSTAYMRAHDSSIRQQHEQRTRGEKEEKFFAIGMPLLALSMLLVHLFPSYYLWIAFTDVFVLALAMGATAVIPSYDDAFADVTIVLVVSFLFGPLLALIGYVIVGLIKQELNPAAPSLLGLTIGIPYALMPAFMSSATEISHFLLFGLFNFMGFFAVVVAFGGWIISSFFRPMGE
jgi:hypothetical protein